MPASESPPAGPGPEPDPAAEAPAETPVPAAEAPAKPWYGPAPSPGRGVPLVEGEPASVSPPIRARWFNLGAGVGGVLYLVLGIVLLGLVVWGVLSIGRRLFG